MILFEIMLIFLKITKKYLILIKIKHITLQFIYKDIEVILIKVIILMHAMGNIYEVIK